MKRLLFLALLLFLVMFSYPAEAAVITLYGNDSAAFSVRGTKTETVDHEPGVYAGTAFSAAENAAIGASDNSYVTETGGSNSLDGYMKTNFTIPAHSAINWIFAETEIATTAGVDARHLAFWNYTSSAWFDVNTTSAGTADYILGFNMTNAADILKVLDPADNSTITTMPHAYGGSNDDPKFDFNRIIISYQPFAGTVSSCKILNFANTIYTLTANVSSGTTCFTIGANNITLDGNGYWVNYSQSSTGYAINNSGGYDNITIRNLNIVQTNASVGAKHAIYASGMANSTIQNNTLNIADDNPSFTSDIYLDSGSDSNIIANNTIIGGAYNYGIRLYSSTSNTLSNNTINRSGTSGPGIYLWLSSSNTLSNNTITTSNTNDYGIIIDSSSNSNTLSSNTITTSGTGAYGIYLSSSTSNTLSSNIVKTSNTNARGIILDGALNNSITGGSIIAAADIDYRFLNSGSNNNFTDTNFTAQRSIWFNDNSSWFNYNNQTGGNIWLKTNVSAQSSINRTLANWNNTLLKWNDTNSTAGLTARYNITGLQASAQYTVTNSSSAGSYSQNLQTDASGNLPSFTIFLNGNTEIKAEAQVGISSCQNLNTANTVYNLTANVSSSSTCFTILANNITLDGNGYWVNYSQSSAGYAINNSGGYDNITIRNLNIMQGSASINAYAIYGSGMGNSTIANNTIITSGQYGYGVRLDSSNFTAISNNTFNTSGSDAYGVLLYAGSGVDTISNNNINTSGTSGYGIVLYTSTESNIVSNNNITTSNTWSAGVYLYSYSSLNNVTNNYIVTSSTNSRGIDTVNTNNYNIIANNTIITSGTGGIGIRLSNYTSSNTLSNNNITTTGTTSYGIYVRAFSNFNIFLNNNITTTNTGSDGIGINSSSSNSITGGSVVARAGSDYYLENASAANNFTSTNLTARRQIYFYDSTSWFNYNNQTSGNIWLKTGVFAASSINRTLVTWSQATMKWNDTNSTAGITARYNITGLQASTQYAVTNSSASGTTSQTLTTDSGGNLPSFTIFLNGKTEIKVFTTSISSCQSLDTANTIYTLTANVSSADYCFHIIANNVTLDGNGFWINYSQSSTGYAVNNSGGYDNITIRNLNIVQGSTSTMSYAIYAVGMGNSTITNNTINTSGSDGYGIYLYSASNSNMLANNTITTSGAWGLGIYLSSSSKTNTLSSNNITTSGSDGYGIYLYAYSNASTLSNNTITTSGSDGYGIYIWLSSPNNITDGSIISKSSYDYYIRLADTTNNFTDTNFTAQRRIYFYDTSSWFNYRNGSLNNIWLKTNISLAAGGSINRTLSNWGNTFLKWNDTNSTAGLTARYNITGLQANSQYTITNSSSAGSYSQNLQTDASGNLPSFTILLIGNTEIKAEQSVANNPPKWSNNQSAIGNAGQVSYFNTTWTDDGDANGFNFSSFQLGFPNGTLANYTAWRFPNNVSHFNATLQAGNHNWTSFANDSSNAWNGTSAVGFSVSGINNPSWLANATKLSSLQTYNTANNYGFQINWTDSDGNFANATFQLGRPSGTLTNYTISSTPATQNNSASGRDVWHINFTQDQLGPAGTYNYTWFGIDTGGLQNKTGTTNYVINKQTINLILSPETQAITYGTSVLQYCSDNSTSYDCTLWKDNANITSKNNTNEAYGAGTHDFIANMSAPLENYSWSEQSSRVAINKAATLARLFLNGTEGSRNYSLNQMANFTVTLDIGGKTVYLYANISGFALRSGTTPLYNLTMLQESKTYNVTGYFPGEENYSASSATYYITTIPLCSSNSTDCITQTYHFSGWAFDSKSGNLLDNGTIKVQVKQTGDFYSSYFTNGYFSIYPQFCLSPGKTYKFDLELSSESGTSSVSYHYHAKTPSENNVSCSTSQQSCSFREYPISGWALDSKTGSVIQNGTVKVFASETGDSYSSPFTNGYFSLNPQFCLSPGRLHDFALVVEGEGKTGYITYKKSG